jgi:CheY-like chemotaxis protein
VLLVEDHADEQFLYARYFLARGFRVQTAGDGETAVRRAVASPPDVIVMDLSLPRLDGWEATRQLKRDARTAHVPIVACTGHAFGSAVERAIEVGCDAYVVKPCLPEDLMRVVEDVLRRFSARREA